MLPRITWCLVMIVLITGPVRADLFLLQNDGRIVGQIVADPELPRDQLRIKTPAGGELLLQKSLIKQIVLQTADEELYEARRGDYADTVAGQWALAEWCRERNLNKQRVVHLERVIELSPDHQQARTALGYLHRDGRWLRYEEMMQERGYVLYKGQWKLPQEIELLEKKRETEQREKEWYQRLIKLRAEYLHVSKAKSQEAWEALKAIDDPHAVPAMIAELGREKHPRLIEAYLAALGRIGGTQGLTFLAQVVFNEKVSDAVQEFALDQLKGGKHPEITGLISGELKSKDNKRVNKAGKVLGELADPTVIPHLIEALVTRHKFQISQGGNGSTSASFSPGGGGGFGVGGKPQIIEQDLQNPDVLAALYKLTGQQQGFDYNIAAWRAWYDANRNKPVISGRRD